jgi:hypothetical protein
VSDLRKWGGDQVSVGRDVKEAERLDRERYNPIQARRSAKKGATFGIAI